MPEPQDIAALREARKHGTDTPGRPTDEFVLHAFAEGARSLWPDSRDPGWHVTFRRWLERRDAALLSEVERGRALRAAVEALAEEWRAEVTAPFGEAHMSFAFAAHMLERILAAHVPSPLPVGGAAGAGEVGM